jgi:PAS domain S-box-containing protein
MAKLIHHAFRPPDSPPSEPHAAVDAELRFAAFMEHLPGLAWIKDEQGRYVFANASAEQVFGVPREQLYGRTDAEIFPPETAEQFRRNDQRALALGTRLDTVETLEHDDGTHHSLVIKFPIPGPAPGTAWIGGIAIDITDRIRMEQVLLRADQRKDEFLATLAHELRNPLAPISNALHVLEQRGTDEESGRLLAVLRRQTEFLARLVEDLQDASRVASGKIDLRTVVIDLRSVIETAIETSRPKIDALRHRLHVELPPAPVYVQADAVRLTQAFVNLLNNAAKFTPAGGEIELKAARVASEVRVTVRDNGVGIAPDFFPHLFEMFAQADCRTERAHAGLGIGLALTRHLVELHGGRISASSEGERKGSEFVVRLPVPPLAHRGQPGPGQPAAAGDGAARRILVVDDHHDGADTMRVLLTLLGDEVEVAYDGPSAIEAFERFGPAFVLLDLGLPGMSGLAVAERLRDLGGDRFKLIALTGRGRAEDREAPQAAGFDAHIVKPVRLEELMALLGS